MNLVRTLISSVAAGAGKLLRFSATGRPGESFTAREIFQHYGFGSRPKAGAEAIALIQGNQVLVIADDDRRYRMSLEEGEVALYTDEGDFVHFKRGQEIHVNTGKKLLVDAATEVVVNTGTATVNCSGKASVIAQGGVDIDGGTGSVLGVVQGACVCHFTGLAHGDVSSNVKASK